MIKLKEVEVLIDEKITLPFSKDITFEGVYIRIDIDGKKRNLVHVIKMK